jgi:hypothetical protein
MAGLRCQLFVFMWPRKSRCVPPQGAGADHVCHPRVQVLIKCANVLCDLTQII